MPLAVHVLYVAKNSAIRHQNSILNNKINRVSFTRAH